jgi:integrase
VLVDSIDTQSLEVQKQGQVVGFGVDLTIGGRFHRRNERPTTTTYLLYSEDIARLISELIDATTDADPAWRDQVKGDRPEALYILGLITGMREGELFGLRWADVDLDTGALHLVRR